MDIRSPTNIANKSPIQKYIERYCLTCDDKEKCGYRKYDVIEVCAALRLLELKERQMNQYRDRR